MSGQRHRTPRRLELSQHFLRSGALAASLVAHSSVGSNDTVVEVGAGRGALTRALEKRCARLIAVELDESLCTVLRDNFGDSARVMVVQGDFLKCPLPVDEYKVFGNIPFSRTAEMVRRLIDAPTPPTDAYMVVQREAAERFAGWPYASETRISLLLKPWWHVEIARRLRRTDFDPPPSVDCVLLWLARRTRPLVEPSQAGLYRQFIGRVFGVRGQTARDGLRTVFTHSQVARLSSDLRFDAAALPSSLAFDQWLGLFRYFALTQ